MASQPEGGAVRKLFTNLHDVLVRITVDAYENGQREVDKQHPDIAAIRKNINARKFHLMRTYKDVTPQQLSPENLTELAALKGAWEKDYNLMSKRDWEQWTCSPSGLAGRMGLFIGGSSAVAETAWSGIMSPLLRGQSVL